MATHGTATGPLIRRLQVVANPAAGRDMPVLSSLNAVFGSDISWDVSVTQGEGDAERAARDAMNAGVDAVAVYGGDGTVNEVASALTGGKVPLVLLPGGTANVMAHELGIPSDLAQAAGLVIGEHRIRNVDIAETADRKRFFLRAGIGWEAESVQGADRAMKDKFGDLAYVLSGMRELLRTEIAQYRITIDGTTIEAEGVSCMVANSISLGMGELALLPDVKVDDGLLDVVLLRRGDAASLASLASAAVGAQTESDALQRWTGREIRVETEPPQAVVLDGEDGGETPLEVRVLPGAVPVLVPAIADETATEQGRR